MASIDAVLTAENGDDLYPYTYDDYVLDDNNVSVRTKLAEINSQLTDIKGALIYSNSGGSGQAAGDINLTGSWQGYDFLTVIFSYSNGLDNFCSVTVPATTGKKFELFVSVPTSTLLYAGAREVTIKDYTHLTVGQGYLYMGSMNSNADNNAAQVRYVYAHD